MLIEACSMMRVGSILLTYARGLLRWKELH